MFPIPCKMNDRIMVLLQCGQCSIHNSSNLHFFSHSIKLKQNSRISFCKVPLGGRPRIIGLGHEFTMVAYSTKLGANHQPKCRKKKKTYEYLIPRKEILNKYLQHTQLQFPHWHPQNFFLQNYKTYSTSFLKHFQKILQLPRDIIFTNC